MTESYPIIVSASRSTDIPAFYAKWFVNRLAAGYAVWYNPFNQQPMKISFEKTKVVVFWTKNPAPLIPYLHELDERGIHYYFQFTLNDYEVENFEPNVPALEERVETFKRLSALIGKERVIWRFDPIIMTSRLQPRDILKKVWKIGNLIKGCTEKLVFSFVDVKSYRKVQNNLIVFAVLKIKELGPGLHEEHALHIASDALHGDILVVLLGIGAHLEPQHTGSILHLAVAEHDVVVVQRFATAGEHTVAETIGTVLDEDIAVRAIVHLILMCPRSLPSLECNSIVVHREVAALDVYIGTYVDVDSIATGSLHWSSRSKDIEVNELHAITLVYMCGPERRIDEVDTLKMHIVAILNKHQARTHLLQIGTLAVISTTNPKLLPVAQAIAIDGSLASQTESVAIDSIDERGKVLKVLSLHTSIHQEEVSDKVTALEHGTRIKVQVCTWLEEE